MASGLNQPGQRGRITRDARQFEIQRGAHVKFEVKNPAFPFVVWVRPVNERCSEGKPRFRIYELRRVLKHFGLEPRPLDRKRGRSICLCAGRFID